MDCACAVEATEGGGVIEGLITDLLTAPFTIKCNECHRDIREGEEYESATGVFDGEDFRHRTCLDCLSIREIFFYEGWTYESLMDDLWNHVQDVDGSISESCMSELTPGARSKVCKLIEGVWATLDE